MPAEAVWALEIVPHDQAVDARTRALRQVLGDLGAHADLVSHGRLYLLDAPESPELTNAALALCLDPVIADACPGDVSRGGDGWVIEVLPHPGVTDAEGDSLAAALAQAGFKGVHARAGHRYHLHGDLDAAVVAAAAHEVAHDVVESVRWRVAAEPVDAAWWQSAFMPDAAPDPTVETVPIRGLDAAALAALSSARLLALPQEDMAAVRDYYTALGREPTDVELETIAQTWSEHCAHRTFKATIDHREPNASAIVIQGLLKTTIVAATEKVDRPWVLSAFRDNAGVIAFDRDHDVCVQGRDAQPPSRHRAVRRREHRRRRRDPRRARRLGAEPIANTDVFCFGPPDTAASSVCRTGMLAPAAHLRGRRRRRRATTATTWASRPSTAPSASTPGYIGNPLVFCGTRRPAAARRRPTTSRSPAT